MTSHQFNSQRITKSERFIGLIVASSKRFFVLTVTLIVYTLFTVGCSNPFNPDMRQQRVTTPPIGASDPRILLTNLEDAYNQQNIELYKSCLSDSFVFVLLSSEYNEIGVDMEPYDGIKDNWWGVEQEVQYHENLFGSGSSDGKYPPPYNISLNLQIPPEEMWQQNNEVGKGHQIIIPCFFDLSLNFEELADIKATGKALFYVQEENGFWKIIRWQDESSI
ncbi:MAG: hypothetical protein K8S56_10115 [Candidatus Cloacimonetes bacterium]|nr:hypothetical protein [Candidatus Cloacimonadota bacterium]